MKKIDKIGLMALSIVFTIGGVCYIFWGGNAGEVFPIPIILAPLWYRLLLGFGCIAAGVMSLIEYRRIKNKDLTK